MSQSIEEKRKIDRERKRAERANNTAYAQRVRESKRSASRLARRQELRQREEQKKKERDYARHRRNRPDVQLKEKCRSILRWAVQSGKIKVPHCCEICQSPDVRLRDGRRGLRADHYAGYDKPLVVRFICIKCDGEQERQRGNTTLGKKVAVA